MILCAYPSREEMAQALAARIADELRAALVTGGRATLSVPGGTTPAPVFDVLALADLDWARVDVLLNDERWVDEDSPRSNTRLLRDRLLVQRAAAARLLPMHAVTATPEQALPALTAAILPALPLTVALLGMGADMHTASLFPGADHLAAALASDAPPLMALRSDAAGEPRLTLTAPVLRGARHLHILITGADKHAAVLRAAELSPLQAPVACVLDRATVHWAD